MVTFPIVASFPQVQEAVEGSFVSTFFVALPTGLSSLGITGQIIAVLLFSLTFIAALTSAISLLEVPVSSLMDGFGWNRNKAVILSTLLIFVLGVPSAISEDFLGKMFAYMDILLLFGGLLISILIGWFVTRTYDKDLSESNSNIGVRRYLKFMLRWVSPIAIAFGLFVSVYDLVKPAVT